MGLALQVLPSGPAQISARVAGRVAHSTLTLSAPRSARKRPATGPAQFVVTSMTRSPASGRVRGRPATSAAADAPAGGGAGVLAERRRRAAAAGGRGREPVRLAGEGDVALALPPVAGRELLVGEHAGAVEDRRDGDAQQLAELDDLGDRLVERPLLRRPRRCAGCWRSTSGGRP